MNKKNIQSICRAISVLNSFNGSEELGITEISKIIGLHKSTTFNIVSTLEHCDFLEKNDSTSKYRLGNELFRLGTMVKPSLRQMALPYLETLVEQFKETVNLVIRDDKNIIYMEKIESPYSVRISTTVGVRIPLNATAGGKSILSGLPEDELMQVLDEMPYPNFTNNTLCTKEDLFKDLCTIRDCGYAEDREEFEIGLTCVAAQIYNHVGIPFAAISVSGPTSRMTDSTRKKIAKTLINITDGFSRKLGYNG